MNKDEVQVDYGNDEEESGSDDRSLTPRYAAKSSEGGRASADNPVHRRIHQALLCGGGEGPGV